MTTKLEANYERARREHGYKQEFLDSRHNISYGSRQTKQQQLEESNLTQGLIPTTAHTTNLYNQEEQNLLESLDKNVLDEYIEKLTPRQGKVISKRFYQGKTLKEIGKEFCRSAESIRQIEIKAISRLRHFIITKDKLGFYDFF